MSQLHGPTFDARACYHWQPNRLYRVHVIGPELYFLIVPAAEDPRAVDNGNLIWAQLGLLGLLVMAGRNRRKENRAQLDQDAQPSDQCHPRDRIHEHKHNFVVSAPDVEDCTILPGKKLGAFGAHAARWDLKLLGRSRMMLQFEDVEHVHAALDVLPPVLGRRLTVRVQWNDTKQRYEQGMM